MKFTTTSLRVIIGGSLKRWMVRFYKIQCILAGNYRGVSERGQKNTPIITRIEVNTLFTLQNSTESFLRMPKFFSEALPPTPYPITNTSLHDITVKY